MYAMSFVAKALAFLSYFLASVAALSDKPSALSLAATTGAIHDAQSKSKGTIGIHDAQVMGQSDRNYDAAPPSGTLHEPTADVQLHLEQAGCSSDSVAVNLGMRTSPEACAAAVLGHGACHRSFMFAPSHREWGCRCCGRGIEDESSLHQPFGDSPAWNLYIAGIAEAGAEVVESHPNETSDSHVVWVARSDCGCNPCPCFVVEQPPVPSAPVLATAPSEVVAWAATQSVNAAVWQSEIDSLAALVSHAEDEASRSSAEARAAEISARRAQVDATAAMISSEVASVPAQDSSEVTEVPCDECNEVLTAVDIASVEQFGRQVGADIGAAAQAYSGDGYAPHLAAGDGVAQGVRDFVAAADAPMSFD